MMKNSITLLFLLFLFQINAQNSITLTEGKPVLVYSLPKTILNICITVENTKLKPGVFYQYAERYLATNNIITEEKSTSKLKNIQINTSVLADPKRTYIITPDNNSVLNKLVLNEKGLLCGINIENTNPRLIHEKIINNNTLSSRFSSDLLPLGEEFMMAGSSAKLAEGAAKQIYRIRESRLSLLTGDLEHLPADGKSMESMLKGMNDLEQQLTELFIGKTTIETQTKTITFVPDSAFNNKILFRLSAFNGIVDTDDLSGKPYFITIEPVKIQVKKPDEKEKIEPSSIFSIIPATTKITISDGINIISIGNFEIPQLGELMPLNDGIFKNPKIKIRINPETGRLVSIN